MSFTRPASGPSGIRALIKSRQLLGRQLPAFRSYVAPRLPHGPHPSCSRFGKAPGAVGYVLNRLPEMMPTEEAIGSVLYVARCGTTAEVGAVPGEKEASNGPPPRTACY